MNEAIIADDGVDFLVTAADSSLFHRLSGYMTDELRQSGHDRPEGSLSADELRQAQAIFAFRGLAVLGMIVVSLGGEGEPARLYRLWIAPSARGLGAGRALMLRAERFVAKNGGCAIEFNTGEDLASAVALYRSMNYREQSMPERSARSLWFRKSLAAGKLDDGPSTTRP